MKRRTVVLAALFAALAAYIGGRIVHPPKYIDVSDWFARPIATVGAHQPRFDVSAQACGGCHQDAAHEWSQTMHAHVWDDDAFQADWRHEQNNPICLNCHTPLDRQQQNLVLTSKGGDRWSTASASNPAFDPALQKQGVTCAACHVRDGKVYGPFQNVAAPHQTAAWTSPNESCVRCHLAANTSKASFLSKPPCGTIAEIEAARTDAASQKPSDDGFLESSPISNPAALGCVECHMPAVERPLTPGGPVRAGRRHLWKGGHDPETVRAALTIDFAKAAASPDAYTLTIANTGANHDVPTGPADRQLTVTLQVIDAQGRPLKSETATLRRQVLGRPFLIDLWDTRLRPNAPQAYSIKIPDGGKGVAVEAVVRYWLMDQAHAEKLDFRQPISNEIFRQRIPLGAPDGLLLAHSSAPSASAHSASTFRVSR